MADMLAARRYYGEQMAAFGPQRLRRDRRAKRVEARYLAGVFDPKLELLTTRSTAYDQPVGTGLPPGWLASMASTGAGRRD